MDAYRVVIAGVEYPFWEVAQTMRADWLNQIMFELFPAYKIYYHKNDAQEIVDWYASMYDDKYGYAWDPAGTIATNRDKRKFQFLAENLEEDQ